MLIGYFKAIRDTSFLQNWRDGSWNIKGQIPQKWKSIRPSIQFWSSEEICISLNLFKPYQKVTFIFRRCRDENVTEWIYVVLFMDLFIFSQSYPLNKTHCAVDSRLMEVSLQAIPVWSSLTMSWWISFSYRQLAFLIIHLQVRSQSSLICYGKEKGLQMHVLLVTHYV